MSDSTTTLTPAQLDHLTARFLQWRLPQDFRPDNGISYARPNYPPSVDATPTGTNLLTYSQAADMVAFMARELPSA